MDVAGQLRQLTTRVAHVLPVSDDGGSTAEIVRVLGGPAVGDIRSRCLRLADDTGDEVALHHSYWHISCHDSTRVTQGIQHLPKGFHVPAMSHLYGSWLGAISEFCAPWSTD